MPDDPDLLTDTPHATATEDIAGAVDVDPATGLTSDEAARRQERYGPNSLGRQKGTPW